MDPPNLVMRKINQWVGWLPDDLLTIPRTGPASETTQAQWSANISPSLPGQPAGISGRYAVRKNSRSGKCGMMRPENPRSGKFGPDKFAVRKKLGPSRPGGRGGEASGRADPVNVNQESSAPLARAAPPGLLGVLARAPGAQGLRRPPGSLFETLRGPSRDLRGPPRGLRDPAQPKAKT